MIVEIRTYTMKPGKVNGFLKLVESEGLAIQKRHLGTCLGFYSSDVGPQNQVMQMWAYEDYADREKRRAAIAKDPAWQAYAPKTLEFLDVQESRIMIAAPFNTP